MWFDEIMDDCKKAMQISNDNKGIFVPIFIKLGLSIIYVVYFITAFAAYIISLIRTNFHGFNLPKFLISVVPRTIALLFIGYLLIVICNSLLEAGSINLYKSVVSGEKPKSGNFFEGIKKYFGKVLGGTIFLNAIVLVLSPLILVLFIIYAVIAGTLTAGWALTFLSVVILVYFMAWTTILVVDDITPIKAIGRSIRLGRKYYWGMFIIMLSYTLLTGYLVSIFGPIVALLAGWFIGGIVLTYFKVVILLIYNRKKTELE